MHGLSILFLAALVAVAPIALAAAGTLEIKCDKDADSIKAAVEGGRTILSLTSKSGIGGATVERKAEHWPQEVVLRLYLSGLESLAISSGDLRLATSVVSHDGSMKRLELWKGGDECPQLDESSPYWMDIRTLDAEGKPVKGLPPKGGWFEMKVPKGLLGDQTKVVTLGWISSVWA